MSMLFERLTGENVVALIRNWQQIWNNRITKQLRQLELFGGPGVVVQKKPNGTFIYVKQPSVSATHSIEPFSLFKVTMEGENIKVSGGYINRNGIQLFWWPGEVTLKAAAGAVCICTEPKDKLGNWTDVSVKIMTEPNCCAFPVAEIEKSGDTFLITQYPVTVATIIYAKKCPIAEL